MSQQINLYTPILLKKQALFSSRTMMQGLTVVAIGMLAGYASLLYVSKGLKEQEVRAQQEFDMATAQFSSLGLNAQGAAPGPSKALEEEIVRLQLQRKQQSDLIDRLSGADVGNVEGFSKYLTALARQPLNGLWITGFSVGGSNDDIVIRGQALRPDLVPAYIRQLGREDVLRGRKMNELRVVAVEDAAKPAPAAVGAAPAPSPGSTREPIQKNRYVKFTLSSASSGGRPQGAQP